MSKDMPEVWTALQVLLDAGIDKDVAIKSLGVLTEAGFLVTRTQTLLDRMICLTMEDTSK